MPRNLIMILVGCLFSISTFAQKKPQSENLLDFQKEVVATAEMLINSKLSTTEKLKSLKIHAALFGDHWFSLIKKGAGREEDLLNPASDYTKAFLTYQNFILVSNLRTERTQGLLKISQTDCQEKKYQMQMSYRGFGAPSDLPPTEQDEVIEKLRESLCRDI